MLWLANMMHLLLPNCKILLLLFMYIMKIYRILTCRYFLLFFSWFLLIFFCLFLFISLCFLLFLPLFICLFLNLTWGRDYLKIINHNIIQNSEFFAILSVIIIITVKINYTYYTTQFLAFTEVETFLFLKIMYVTGTITPISIINDPNMYDV